MTATNLTIKKKKESKSSYFVITDKKGKVFEIDCSGRVWWLKKGKLTLAKTDPQLGAALGEALTTIMKLYKL